MVEQYKLIYKVPSDKEISFTNINHLCYDYYLLDINGQISYIRQNQQTNIDEKAIIYRKQIYLFDKLTMNWVYNQVIYITDVQSTDTMYTYLDIDVYGKIIFVFDDNNLILKEERRKILVSFQDYDSNLGIANFILIDDCGSFYHINIKIILNKINTTALGLVEFQYFTYINEEKRLYTEALYALESIGYAELHLPADISLGIIVNEKPVRTLLTNGKVFTINAVINSTYTKGSINFYIIKGSVDSEGKNIWRIECKASSNNKTVGTFFTSNNSLKDFSIKLVLDNVVESINIASYYGSEINNPTLVTCYQTYILTARLNNFFDIKSSLSSNGSLYSYAGGLFNLTKNTSFNEVKYDFISWLSVLDDKVLVSRDDHGNVFALPYNFSVPYLYGTALAGGSVSSNYYCILVTIDDDGILRGQSYICQILATSVLYSGVTNGKIGSEPEIIKDYQIVGIADGISSNNYKYFISNNVDGQGIADKYFTTINVIYKDINTNGIKVLYQNIPYIGLLLYFSSAFSYTNNDGLIYLTLVRRRDNFDEELRNVNFKINNKVYNAQGYYQYSFNNANTELFNTTNVKKDDIFYIYAYTSPPEIKRVINNDFGQIYIGVTSY